MVVFIEMTTFSIMRLGMNSQDLVRPSHCWSPAETHLGGGCRSCRTAEDGPLPWQSAIVPQTQAVEVRGDQEKVPAADSCYTCNISVVDIHIGLHWT